jgi:hypothetical protein
LAVDLVTARKHVLSLLNVSKGYADASVDPRHRIEEVTETIIQMDGKCYEAILLNPKHGTRPSLLSWTVDLSRGDALPAHITRDRVEIKMLSGDPGYVKGIEVSEEDITLLANNLGGIYTGDGNGHLGYYNLDGGVADFTGNRLRFKYGNYVRNASACQSPDFCYPTVVSSSLGVLMLKDGDDPQAASLFQNIGDAGLSMILSGRADIPDLPSKYRMSSIPANQVIGG